MQFVHIEKCYIVKKSIDIFDLYKQFFSPYFEPLKKQYYENNN